ncbi:MAG: NYN domain-containing protein, partial [Phycisphaerales bacterium]|nr:NYN domain-containing protein [Phycisphaerales bacterium]
SNILHVTGVLPPELAGPDERGLVDMIRRSRWRGERIWIVCDGGRRASSSQFHDGAVLHHAGPGSDADTVIAKLIETCSHCSSLIVVTSDRRVAAHARRRHCRTMRSEEFLEMLARDCTGTPSRGAGTSTRRATAAPAASRPAAQPAARAPSKPSGDAERNDAAQVAAWLAYFGLAEDRSKSVEHDAAHAAEREAARLARELGIRARDAARRRTR